MSWAIARCGSYLLAEKIDAKATESGYSAYEVYPPKGHLLLLTDISSTGHFYNGFRFRSQNRLLKLSACPS